jgi:hypothetical protein
MTELIDPPASSSDRRSRGISYQQVLDSDTHRVPPVLRVDRGTFLGDTTFR